MSLTVSQVSDDSTHRVLFNCVGCWNCKIYPEFNIVLVKAAAVNRLTHCGRDAEYSHGREQGPCGPLFIKLLQEQCHECAVIFFVRVVAHHELIPSAGVVQYCEARVNSLVIACKGYGILLRFDRPEPVVVAENSQDRGGRD